jgi:hypothetical protein
MDYIIFPRETEYKPLLDRAKSINDAKSTYSKQLTLLNDLVNYGSNLIARVWDSCQKTEADFVVTILLLRHLVTMLDSVEILISYGTSYPAYVGARSAFEVSLYIDWILKSNTKDRAHGYVYFYYHERKRIVTRYKKGTQQNDEWLKDISDIQESMKLDFDLLDKGAQAELSSIEARLINQNWKDFIETYGLKHSKGMKAKKISRWFQVFDVKGLKDLAGSVNRSSEYVLYYSDTSSVIHGEACLSHGMIKTLQHGLYPLPIRRLDDAEQVLRFTTFSVINTYLSILKYYRPGERSTFSRNYQGYWRQAFLNIPEVKYNLSEK